MRSSSFASSSSRKQFRLSSGDPAVIEGQEASRLKAIRESASVRRAIRAARSEANAVIGFAATIEAVTHEAVSELLVTRRFAEFHPAAAANLVFLATTSGGTITRVTGAAELELDLAGGVAALLRRRMPRQVAV